MWRRNGAGKRSDVKIVLLVFLEICLLFAFVLL